MKTILLTLFILPVLSISQTQIGQNIDGVNALTSSGERVSLSSNGNIVAIGAPYDYYETDGNDFGHVRVYENINGTWSQIGQDIKGEAAGNYSSRDMSLSPNGNIIAIGSVYNDGINGNESGHVRIYEYVVSGLSGVWTQIGTDIDGEAPNDNSGRSISLSLNGDIVAIGARGNDENGTWSGHVRVFERIQTGQTTNWVQIGQDIDGEAAYDYASSVSLSFNGNIVAIGANGNDGINDTNSGRVRIYENVNGVWTQIGQDIFGEVADDYARGISLNSNGNIIAINGRGYDGVNNIELGRIRVYENVNDVWVQIGQDIFGDNPNDGNGGFSISSNGNIIAKGSYRNDENGTDSGKVKIFKNINDVWTQIGQDILGEKPYDYSGISVSLSLDGSIVAIGATGADALGTSTGHVKVYDLSNTLSLEDSEIDLNIKLLPNPTSNFLNIDLIDNSELKKVKIYNNIGQLVSKETKSKINISKYSKGLYFAEILTTKGKVTKKFIVE